MSSELTFNDFDQLLSNEDMSVRAKKGHLSHFK